MQNILIVVDMQNDFIDGALGTKEAEKIVANVKEKIDTYRSNNDEVIFTRDTHFDNYLETQEGKNLPVKHCIKDTFGWQISGNLDVADSVVIDKPTFGSTKLMEYLLSKQDISEIQLVGLCTDICVLSNALSLRQAVPWMPITVDASCCAGVTPEKHLAAVEVMKSWQINVINE